MSMDALKEEVSVQKVHPLAIAGMVMAFIPLFNCFAFPVSIIALVRTRNNDLEYKGIGLCIAALSVSLMTSALMILVIQLVVLPKLADAKRNTWAIQSIDNQRGIGVAYTQYLGDNDGWYPVVQGNAGVGGKQGNSLDSGMSPLPDAVSHIFGAKVPAKERPLNKYIGNLEIFHDPADGGSGALGGSSLAYNEHSCWESFGNSYQPQVAEDLFRVKRVLGVKAEKGSYAATSMNESELVNPVNMIIQGDWNWPFDREDAWYGRNGNANHIMLYGDGHVDQFVFPPATTMTNWLLKPAPDPNYTWW